MRPLLYAAFAAAVFLTFARPALALSHVPKWVHDMRVQRVAELKEQIANASAGSASNLTALDSADVARLAEELSCLQSEEDRLQDDKRSVALFATVIMVILFLLFFLTTMVTIFLGRGRTTSDMVPVLCSILQGQRADLLDLRL
ncbi:hypothetical protein BESB_020220 [Besnoitia besnoiti]|uniref:Transmembrane protein n=1 Tax=Besnoitia besnoiti TaxID=94643 RepID=A0A2A9M701_BESBE|nr:hypothetical protein BESB_020220 [Besnoitia besnoiti]PFH32081.1 hypothetical protein BESB_020220 [Besnoitia besnoiti]